MNRISATSIIKRQEHVPHKEVAKRGILLRLKDGDYFTLNEIGLYIWKSLNGTRDLTYIAKQLSSRYTVKKDVALADLITFVKALHKKRLVTIYQKSK